MEDGGRDGAKETRQSRVTLIFRAEWSFNTVTSCNKRRMAPRFFVGIHGFGRGGFR